MSPQRAVFLWANAGLVRSFGLPIPGLTDDLQQRQLDDTRGIGELRDEVVLDEGFVDAQAESPGRLHHGLTGLCLREPGQTHGAVKNGGYGLLERRELCKIILPQRDEHLDGQARGIQAGVELVRELLADRMASVRRKITKTGSRLRPTTIVCVRSMW
jgi:hypothetical protein